MLNKVRFILRILVCQIGTLGYGNLHLHHLSKIKSHKEDTKSRNQGFSYYIADDRRIQIWIRTAD
jgi:hypothetical protein